MFPDVLLTNDANPPSEILFGAVVGDFAVISSKATLLPGVRIGSHAVIGAHSLVTVDVESGMFANGTPAKTICKASSLRMKTDVRIKAYPWNKRFDRGYPKDIQADWSN
jgi:acetyltransferase-like isoleucine patch superfamily enzyme